MEKFWEHFCFESCEHSVETADEKNKVTSWTLWTALIVSIFKFVSYFYSPVISDKIKYYFTTNRRNFLKMQYAICKYALQIHYALLLEDSAFTEKSRILKTGTWLSRGWRWKVMKTLGVYGIVQVSLFLLRVASIIGNAQGARAGGKDMYLTD